ncbi:Uncharacterized protein MK1188 [Methanopyrus kandleri AV19]|uniref:Uncharacterized protein n=1 Tax=Methanopyrus kandleri (strain AV19 / DSM 6324 / JCM 9639 / NBRC 100938) TaxID=190192 RepID=Q8TW48_METKA|nr:Uncharacterized protein MK1188 [Methanopyrus kandleri AV19]
MSPHTSSAFGDPARFIIPRTGRPRPLPDGAPGTRVHPAGHRGTGRPSYSPLALSSARAVTIFSDGAYPPPPRNTNLRSECTPDTSNSAVPVHPQTSSVTTRQRPSSRTYIRTVAPGRASPVLASTTATYTRSLPAYQARILVGVFPA